ncbi:serine hydrolase [Streptomyces sp. NPDC046805]|uniref:serine hydrolase n=1 Tax=Streptomyces sp. NPDC046805 TaxID=3155134 RepID=UPI0033E590C2
MPHRLSSVSPPPSAGTRKSPRRRAAMCAGVLVAAVTTLAAAGTLDTAFAASGPASSGSDTATTRLSAPARSQDKARVTAAVLDLDDASREPVVYGDDTPYDTASIVKVDILAAALLQAQDAGRHLTEREQGEAKVMIERSDNAAANALWRHIGRAPGLEKANERLGLTRTKGGPGSKWGLTRTTASDQIRLLGAVFRTGPAAYTGPSVLSEASRAYIRSLMARIVDEQAWGVSAASGSDCALKNGWLQRTTTGLWDVNSVGQITVDGHHYLVAALSDGTTSMKSGISLVEQASRAAVFDATAS